MLKYLSSLMWCLIIGKISWKIFSVSWSLSLKLSKACLVEGGKHWSAVIFSQDLVMRSDKMLLFINSSTQCWCFIRLCLSNPFWVLYVLLQIAKVPQLFSNDSWQETFFCSGLSLLISSFCKWNIQSRSWLLKFCCSCNTYS